MGNLSAAVPGWVVGGVIILLAICAPSGRATVAQVAQDAPKPAGEDKVYSKDEVDVKAKVKNIKELDLLRHAKPEEADDCEDGAEVALRAVFHKSGKVTEVTLVKPMGCGLDEVAVRTVRKAKFTPAVKNGVPVSQYTDIEYQFRRY